MLNPLILDGWTVSAVDVQPGRYVIEAAYDTLPEGCGKVDCAGELTPWGGYKRRIVDTPAHGRQVVINVDVRRMRCQACGATITQPIPDVDDRRHMTARCREYIERQSLIRPNLHVATEIGIDEKVVRRISRAHVEQLEAQHRAKLQAPRFLGIDDVVLGRATRAIFIDLEAGRVLEILPDYKLDTVYRFLISLPGREGIEAVCADMAEHFFEAVKQALPHAAVIADKWHVQAKALDAVDEARRAFQRSLQPTRRKQGIRTSEQRRIDKQVADLRNNRPLFLRRYHDNRMMSVTRFRLDTYLANMPRVSEVYWLKEQFLGIWNATTPQTAAELIDAWQSKVGDRYPEFGAAISALYHWRREILAGFVYKGITNAQTEAINGIIKLAYRQGRGYRFEQIRARALWGERPKPRPRKHRPETVERMARRAEARTLPTLRINEPLDDPSLMLVRCMECSIVFKTARGMQLYADAPATRTLALRSHWCADCDQTSKAELPLSTSPPPKPMAKRRKGAVEDNATLRFAFMDEAAA